MATQYDAEEARIKRQLALAQALRDSGQADPNMVTRSAGGYVIPVSPWETLSKVAGNAFGGYTQGKAEQAAEKLDAQKQTDSQDWMSKLPAAVAPDELQPVRTTQSLVNPTTGGTGELTQDDPTAFARQIAGAIKNQTTADAAQVDVDANDKTRRMAQYMKGMQLGGIPAAIGAEGLQREVLPKEKTPYTLSEGDVRFGADDKVVAKGLPKQYKPPADSDVTMNIVDPKAPGGRRTIFRRNFDPNTQQEWIKPEKDPLAMNDQQQSEVDKLAKAIVEYRMAPMPMGTRNPLNAAVMARVQDMSAELGEDYDAKQYASRAKALSNYLGTGTRGRTVTSFNVAIDHLHTLETAAEAMKNGNVQLMNSIKNQFKQQFGSEAPTTLDALKANIQGELVKAITGGPGAESDRKEALTAIQKASSPAQIADALKGIRALMGGQLQGLQREFKASTGFGDQRFATLLSPAAKEILASLPEDSGNPGAADAAKTAPTLRTKKIGNVTYKEVAPGEWEAQ